jgi:hypothetical protein
MTSNRSPRIRICDMPCNIGFNCSASVSSQAPAPPMRIMRRSRSEKSPSNARSAPGPSESETSLQVCSLLGYCLLLSSNSLQSREEAYAKARAKLFQIEDDSNVDESLTVEDMQYQESRNFDIEPHEEELYRRNVRYYC